jgi:hypothetical protein
LVMAEEIGKPPLKSTVYLSLQPLPKNPSSHRRTDFDELFLQRANLAGVTKGRSRKSTI